MREGVPYISFKGEKEQTPFGYALGFGLDLLLARGAARATQTFEISLAQSQAL